MEYIVKSHGPVIHIDRACYRTGDRIPAGQMTESFRRSLLDCGHITAAPDGVDVQKRAELQELLEEHQVQLSDLQGELAERKAETAKLLAATAKPERKNKMETKTETKPITKSGAADLLEQYLVAKRAPGEDSAATLLRLSRAGDSVVARAYDLYTGAAPDLSVNLRKSAVANDLERYCELNKVEGEDSAAAFARLAKSGDPLVSKLYELHDMAKGPKAPSGGADERRRRNDGRR